MDIRVCVRDIELKAISYPQDFVADKLYCERRMLGFEKYKNMEFGVWHRDWDYIKEFYLKADALTPDYYTSGI